MSAQPDMSRPVPAAPSPGSSAKRAKLTDADRKRIGEEQKYKRQGKPSRLESKGIYRRFTRGDEEWAILNDGHLWVFRAGDLEPGALVRAREGLLRGRLAKVRQLIPSACGMEVVAVVSWQQIPGERRRPGVLWHRDDLEVMVRAR